MLSVHGKIFVLGSGGHAVALMDAARSAGFTVMGFVDQKKSGELCGLPILRNVRETEGHALGLGVGTNFNREKIFLEAKRQLPLAEFPPIIHNSAFVSPLAEVGEGSVVLAMANVGPGAVLERGSCINSGASLDHHSVLKSWSSLGPGVHTGGNVTVGMRAAIGLSASILQGVTVGNDSLIGAHSLVRSDIGDNQVAYGVPVRIVRTRMTEDPYY